MSQLCVQSTARSWNMMQPQHIGPILQHFLAFGFQTSLEAALYVTSSVASHYTTLSVCTDRLYALCMSSSLLGAHGLSD